MTAIRVATWNLWWRFGDPERRRPAITAVLRELDADVVGLQEVWSLGGQDLAGGLVAELDRHVTFVPVPDASHWTDRLGDTRYGLGNAVLSRWPLREVHTEVLPAGGEAQVLLSVVADTPAGSLRCVTTHLTPSLTASAQRRTGPGPRPARGDGGRDRPTARGRRRLQHGAGVGRDAPARGAPDVLLGFGRGRVPVRVEGVGLFGTRPGKGCGRPTTPVGRRGTARPSRRAPRSPPIPGASDGCAAR